VTDNYVSIKLKADNGAKPDLTDLRARLAELSGKVATARADVDDAAADAKLTDLDAKLLAISKKVSSPRIDMAGAARALAQVTAVDAALDALADKDVKPEVKDGAADAAAAGEKDGLAFREAFRRAAGGGLNDLSSQLGGSGLGKDMEKSGKEEGGFFHNSFVTTFLGGLKGTIIAGLSTAVAALPALGAVAGAGLVIGAGVMIASKIPAIAAQFKGLGTQIMGTLKTAAIKQVGGFVKSIGPELSGMFKAVGPMIGPLLKGLESLVRGLLPGLAAILKTAMPAIKAFAQVLGGLGKDLGGFFRDMAPAVAAAAVAMKAIFGVLGGLFPVIGSVAATLAKVLAPVLTQIGGLFRGLAPVLKEVGAIIGQFAKAFLVNLAGGLTAVVGVIKAVAPAFGILAKALGQVFNLMNNRGVFNDIEDALEDLVGPIGKLVNALASALLPILPPIINIVGKLAGILQGVLVTAVTALTPVLIPLVTILGQLLSEAVLPLLPMITQLAQMLAGFLGQALQALLPSVGQLAMALLKIVAALLPILPPLMQLVNLVVRLALTALTPVIGLVTILAGWLAGLADVIAAVVGWIAKIVAAALGWITNFGKVGDAVSSLFGWIRDHWPLLLAILTGPIGLSVLFVVDHFKTILHAVDSAIDWVKSHWPLLLAIMTGPIGVAVLFIVDHWRQITAGAAGMFRDVTSFFGQLPGRILAMTARFGDLLLSAGKAVVMGLVHGIESMAEAPLHAIESIGGGLLGKAKSVLGIFSPSKKFAELGAQIMTGLALGMTQTSTQVLAKTQSLMKAVVAAAAAGSISGAQSGELGRELGARMQAALKQAMGQAIGGAMTASLSSGVLSKIGHASIAALKQIWDAVSGGLISRPDASGLAAWVKADNARLQTLAKERNLIASRIAAATAFAQSTASSAESSYNLSSAAGSGSTPASAGAIISGLRADVNSVRKFASDLKKLAKMGLNKAYLQQIIAMGPEQGGPLAAELAASGIGDIRQINTAEAQIARASTSLGKQSADELYDSGKQAGKGFLSGLEAQQSQITKMMQKIAKSMVSTLRKELGISSPSRVMRAHGLMIAQGLALGLGDGIGAVGEQALRLARAAGPQRSGGLAIAGAGGGAMQFDIVLTFRPTGKKYLDGLFNDLKAEVRHRGGGGKYSAQKAFGRVWPT
jgi:phage-related protein